VLIGKRIENIFLTIGLVCLAGCSGANNSSSNGGGGTGQVMVTVNPTATSVVVKQTVPFTATVTGTSNTAVVWEVGGVQGGNATVGTIDVNGSYTAPAVVPNPSTTEVTAVSQAQPTIAGSARVQVFDSNSNQAEQTLPVKLGTSGGNIDDKSGRYCCGGTLGSLVIRNGNYYILSNNHVLARSDQAGAGEPISQPGLIDTNCSTSGTHTVANLTSFVNLQTADVSADAAIAQIESGAVDTSGDILSLGGTANGNVPDAGPPHQGNGIAATIGEGVAKSGRTTGLTCSTISATNLTVSVTYQTQCNGGTSFNVSYSNQVGVSGGGFSDAGDSGSLIVDEQTADPVALLFAGSDTETVGNSVADVLTALADQQGNKPSFVGSASTHQVIGCTLAAGAGKAANAQGQMAVGVSATSLIQAQRARDLHAPELLANPYIQAVGVAASTDRPGEAAVLLVVHAGGEPTPLPMTLEGVGTRIVPAGATGPHGILESDVAQKMAALPTVFAVSSLTQAELSRAKAVHAANVGELMKQAGVQGVGITSSADAPGEAALLIYVVRWRKHAEIPVLIDGVRTRVRTTSRFTAGNRGSRRQEGCKLPGVAADTANNAGLPWRRWLFDTEGAEVRGEGGP
jgi:hypothetical protein